MKKKVCKLIVWLFFVLIMSLAVAYGYVYEKQITLHIMTAICVGLLGSVFYDITRWLFKEDGDELLGGGE